jgi:hypothetical protein
LELGNKNLTIDKFKCLLHANATENRGPNKWRQRKERNACDVIRRKSWISRFALLALSLATWATWQLRTFPHSILLSYRISFRTYNLIRLNAIRFVRITCGYSAINSLQLLFLISFSNGSTAQAVMLPVLHDKKLNFFFNLQFCNCNNWQCRWASSA